MRCCVVEQLAAAYSTTGKVGCSRTDSSWLASSYSNGLNSDLNIGVLVLVQVSSLRTFQFALFCDKSSDDTYSTYMIFNYLYILYVRTNLLTVGFNRQYLLPTAMLRK